MRCRVRLFRLLLLSFAAAISGWAIAPAFAERPSAMKLFPEETVVFVRMADAHEFGQRLRDTALGRMIRDPQLQPLVEQLYGDVGRLYADQAEAKVGLTWDDLQNLPRGEVAFGVVARHQRRPALVLLIDQGEESSTAGQLLDRALELSAERGAEISTETIQGEEVTVVRDADRPNRMFGAFQRENTIVVATDPDVLRNVLWQWDGGAAREDASDGQQSTDGEPASAGGNKGADVDDEDNEDADFIPSRTLAENDRFATIVRRCRRPQDPPPHLLFFVDPIELARGLVASPGQNSGGLSFVMGILPALGLDGLLGVGGTITYATDEFDDLTHLHMLLENPRAGVMQLPAFGDGDTTPQPFVPLALESYITGHYNVRASYDRLVALVDKFRYEGSVDKLVKERLSDPLGIDFPTAVIDNLAGRFTWIVAYDAGATFPGRGHLVAAQLSDEAAAIESLKTVMNKHPQFFEERQFGQATYYAIVPEDPDDVPEDQTPTEPCVAVIDGYLFLGSSCQLLERAIAARDGTVDRLVDSADYARTREVLGRETAGATPALFSISRAEESVRHWFELLASEKTRDLIDEHKADNPLLAALADALDQHQLPPFEALAPYFAPGGAVLYDTDTGYHVIGFTLRTNAGE